MYRVKLRHKSKLEDLNNRYHSHSFEIERGIYFINSNFNGTKYDLEDLFKRAKKFNFRYLMSNDEHLIRVSPESFFFSNLEVKLFNNNPLEISLELADDMAKYENLAGTLSLKRSDSYIDLALILRSESLSEKQQLKNQLSLGDKFIAYSQGEFFNFFNPELGLHTKKY